MDSRIKGTLISIGAILLTSVILVGGISATAAYFERSKQVLNEDEEIINIGTKYDLPVFYFRGFDSTDVDLWNTDDPNYMISSANDYKITLTFAANNTWKIKKLNSDWYGHECIKASGGRDLMSQGSFTDPGYNIVVPSSGAGTYTITVHPTAEWYEFLTIEKVE